MHEKNGKPEIGRPQSIDWVAHWCMDDRVRWDWAQRAHKVSLDEAAWLKIVMAWMLAGLALGFLLSWSLEAWDPIQKTSSQGARSSLIRWGFLSIFGAMGVAMGSLASKAQEKAMAAAGRAWRRGAQEEGGDVESVRDSIERAETVIWGAVTHRSTESAAWRLSGMSEAPLSMLELAALLCAAWVCQDRSEEGFSRCAEKINPALGEELAFMALPRMAARMQALAIEAASKTASPPRGSHRPRL